MKRVELGEEVQALGPHMELFVSPRFPVQPLCEQNSLRLLLTQERIAWRQAGFPLGGQSISQHESAIILRPCGSFSMLEANVWGALFYAVKLDQNVRSTDVGIQLNRLVGYVLAFLRHAAFVLGKVGYTGPLFVVLSLKSIRGVPSLWYLYGSAPMNGSGSDLDDEVSFSIDTSQEELNEHFIRISTILLRYAYFAINMPDSADNPEKLRGLLASGYQYNDWMLPPELGVTSPGRP